MNNDDLLWLSRGKPNLEKTQEHSGQTNNSKNHDLKRVKMISISNQLEIGGKNEIENLEKIDDDAFLSTLSAKYKSMISHMDGTLKFLREKSGDDYGLDPGYSSRKDEILGRKSDSFNARLAALTEQLRRTEEESQKLDSQIYHYGIFKAKDIQEIDEYDKQRVQWIVDEFSKLESKIDLNITNRLPKLVEENISLVNQLQGERERNKVLKCKIHQSDREINNKNLSSIDTKGEGQNKKIVTGQCENKICNDNSNRSDDEKLTSMQDGQDTTINDTNQNREIKNRKDLNPTIEQKWKRACEVKIELDKLRNLLNRSDGGYIEDCRELREIEQKTQFLLSDKYNQILFKLVNLSKRRRELIEKLDPEAKKTNLISIRLMNSIIMSFFPDDLREECNDLIGFGKVNSDVSLDDLRRQENRMIRLIERMEKQLIQEEHEIEQLNELLSRAGELVKNYKRGQQIQSVGNQVGQSRYDRQQQIFADLKSSKIMGPSEGGDFVLVTKKNYNKNDR